MFLTESQIIYGKEVIKLITEIGAVNGGKVWLEFGTLLGHVRDGGFIPHDKDIDLGIEYRYWNDDIIFNLKKLGFEIRKKSIFNDERCLKFVGVNKKNKITKFRFRYKNSVNVCFDIFHEGVNEYKNYMYYKQPRDNSHIIELPKNLILPQIRGMFYDVDVWIPENYMGYIKYCYGENWKKPMKMGTGEYKQEWFKNRKRFRRSLN